jgi:hypothetical protein
MTHKAEGNVCIFWLTTSPQHDLCALLQMAGTKPNIYIIYIYLYIYVCIIYIYIYVSEVGGGTPTGKSFCFVRACALFGLQVEVELK